jgi:hypothetical protein
MRAATPGLPQVFFYKNPVIASHEISEWRGDLSL